MLLTLTTTHRPASDLGFLLRKHPAKAHAFSLSFGRAWLVYPEVGEERCTAALVLDVDTVDLVRSASTFEQYVSERPWTASSFLSVALAQTLRSAMAGNAPERPDLALTPIPLEAHLPTLPCRGGEAFLRSLFEPLGYTVEAHALPLDDAHPEWGPSRIHDVTLRATLPLKTLLGHLYVLLPVLDDQKHYYVGEAEVEKLLRHGAEWLATHPQRDAITHRYLRRVGHLTRLALAQLVDEPEPEPDVDVPPPDAAEVAAEAPLSLATQRRDAVIAALRAEGVQSVVDLGCGEGHLLRSLQHDRRFTRIVGVDVAMVALQHASRRLHLDTATEAERERLRLLQGSALYKDERLVGFDAIACVEVMEHLDEGRLDAFAAVVFGALHPRVVVLTTPNAEYNALFPDLAPGRFRHGDHRFEWDRATFAAWCTRVAEAHAYVVRVEPVGPLHATLGAPTQLALFTRAA